MTLNVKGDLTASLSSTSLSGLSIVERGEGSNQCGLGARNVIGWGKQQLRLLIGWRVGVGVLPVVLHLPLRWRRLCSRASTPPPHLRSCAGH